MSASCLHVPRQSKGTAHYKDTMRLVVCRGLYLACLVLLQLQAARASNCPWDSDDLEDWSLDSSWASGSVPEEDDAVVIPKGKAILLDTQLPRLESLTIESGAVLVWGDLDNITIETNYILVKGEFHIGAEECRFTKNAKIVLYGKTDSPHQVNGFGRKFVGVAEGGTLEIHGLPKMSWTKLTGTVGPSDDSCGVVYDSHDTDFSKEKANGLHVVVWNKDGSLFDNAIFPISHPDKSFVIKSQEQFSNFVKELPSDKVVGVAVMKTLGDVTDSSQKWELVYSAIETLGGSAIRDVGALDPYALVAITGDSNSARETRTKGKGDPGFTQEALARLTLKGDIALTFAARSVLTPELNPNEAVFKVLTQDVAFPVLNLMHDVSSWQPGDHIVVASTDYDWRQAEVKTIVECDSCTANQVRVDGEFEYSHFGEITYNVDERGEVGLLSRNIRVEGTLEESCYSNTEKDTELCEKFGRDTFGGHLKVLRNHKSVHIEGAEFFQMGQQAFVGSYPLHFHMCDDVAGMWLRNNSIHESLARCVTVHGTDSLEVSDNVCYRHLGHGYFLEDSAEQNNRIHRNLGIGTMFGTHILSDFAREWCPSEIPKSCGVVSTFWITHPNNYITDNVAAGSDSNGMMVTFSDVPIGPSLQRQKDRGLFQEKSTRYIPVKEFSGNTMHSNSDFGLLFEHRISSGETEEGVYIPPNGMLALSKYSARDPPRENGTRIETVLTRLTFYKNNRFDSWLRCGNIAITQSSYADSPEGFIAAHVDGESSCDVRDTIFVGQTDNKGEPLVWYNRTGIYRDTPQNRPKHTFDRSFPRSNPESTMSGVSFYQGPVFVQNCYFNRFFNWFFNDSFENTWGHRPIRPAAAISFHRSNSYPSMSWSGVSDLKFGYCDGDDNGVYVMHGNESVRMWDLSKDGSELPNFRDLDGSLTGSAGLQVVKNRPFMQGAECLNKTEWGMSVCPYKYVMMSVIGNDGVLSKDKFKHWPILLTRDDQPDDVVNLQGKVSSHFTLRANMSYTIRFNTSLGDTPTYVRLLSYDLEKGDVLRIAICFPKDSTTFEAYSRYPRLNNKDSKPIFVSSLADLDADTSGRAFFWDSDTGLLYLKLMSNETRGGPDELCTGGKCPKIYIYRKDGGSGPAECDVKVTPYNDGQDSPSVPVAKQCTTPDSPKGLGSLRPEDVTEAVTTEIACPVLEPPARGVQELRGCFMESFRLPDFEKASARLYFSMTPQVCRDRCFQRGFPYSAVSFGNQCQCSHHFGRHGPLSMSKCNYACPGDTSQTCGAGARNQVYTTGAAIAIPSRPRCGPGNRGVVYEDVCLYLSPVGEEYPDAERRCANMGGTLTKIDTKEKQHAVIHYLLGITQHIWTGLELTDGQWVFPDGTQLGSYSYWYPGQGSKSKPHVELLANREFQWYQAGFWDNNLPLCDLPLVSPPVVGPSPDRCGMDNKGQRVADGPCYALIQTEVTYDQARYWCYTMGGHLAPVTEAEDQMSAEIFLAQFGVFRYLYWVDGAASTPENAIMYNYRNPRQQEDVAKSTEVGVMCRLDELSDSDKCPTDWIHSGGSCYLHKNDQEANVEFVAARCNSDRASVLRIDSDEENEFIRQLIPDASVWLDLRYSSTVDNFMGSDGTVSIFSRWQLPNPLTSLSSGLCAQLDTASGTWLHKPCYSGTAHVVCEMAALGSTSEQVPGVDILTMMEPFF